MTPERTEPIGFPALVCGTKDENKDSRSSAGPIPLNSCIHGEYFGARGHENPHGAHALVAQGEPNH